MADEDDGDEFSDEDEDGVRRKGHKLTENQYYGADELKKRSKFSMNEYEKKYEEKARREELREQRAEEARRTGVERQYDSDDSDDLEEYDENEDIANEKQLLLPSVNDAKLWQVKVKKNFEKIACMALLNKCIDFQSKGNPLFILSATSSDSTEGWIYIEAFKEIHVK